MPATITQPKFLSLTNVADRWDLDPKTIRRRISEGSLKAVRIGGVIRVPLSEVERVESAQPIGNSQA